MPASEGFEPAAGRDAWPGHAVLMSVDEYEVIRLIDLEGLTQEQCAAQMDIARTTVTGIYDSARRKIADAIVHSKRLKIEGGNYRICAQSDADCGGHSCHRRRCCEKHES